MMSSHQLTLVLWDLFFLLLLSCLCAYSTSIEPISFGIITNDDFRSQPIPTVLTLYWNNSMYECTIKPSKANHLYACDIEETTNKETQNELIMNKMHIISSKHVTIKSIIVWDENTNHHEINMFCPVHLHNNCDNSLSILATIITFPSTEILTTAPNQQHQGFVHHINDNNIKRKLINTESGNLTMAATDNGEEDDSQSNVVEDNPIYRWLDKSNANKFVAVIGLTASLLICCLICYICFLKKRCCFHKKQISSSQQALQSSSSRQQLKPKPASIHPLSVSSTNETAAVPNMTRPNAMSLPLNSVNIQMVSRKKPRTFTSPQLIVPLRDEFHVIFTSKPFGMAMRTMKKDRYSLYVSKVQIDGQAAQNNVKVGYKLVALNGESIEGIGSKDIYRRIVAAGVPLRILFRKRVKKRKKNRRESSEIPSQSGEGSMDEGSFNADLYEDMYGDPVPQRQRTQTPSTHGDIRNSKGSSMSPVNLDAVQEHKYPTPDVSVDVNVGAYDMAAQHIKLQHATAGAGGHNVGDISSDSDDQMYVQGDDTPTLGAQQTVGAHVQSKESMDLQLVAKSSVDIPDLDSSEDNNAMIIINNNANVIHNNAEEIEDNYEVVDDDGNFVFQT